MRLVTIVCSLTSLMHSVAVCCADTPKNDDLAKARALVRALGDKSYKTREHAAQELLKMGRIAYAAVEAGSNDADAEVRSRCRKILPTILDLEIKARLDAFLADTEGKKEHNLPGWKRFRDTFGNTKVTRDLFADMIRADGRLMEEVEVSAKAFAGERLQARVQSLQQDMMVAANTGRGSTVSLREIMQILFLASKPGLELSPLTSQMITSYTYQPNFRQGLSGGDHSDILKKLTVIWLESRISDQNTAYAILNLAITYKFKELIVPALKIAANKDAQGQARGIAIVAVGRLGEKEHVKQLEPLLDDKTQIANFALPNLRGITLIGDVALAQIIHLSGEKPGDFGFEALKANANYLNSYYYLGFENDETRAAARKKWKEHTEKKGPR